MMARKAWYFIFCFIIGLSFGAKASDSVAPRVVRVAVANEPIFSVINKKSEVHGFSIDLIKRIAELNHWQLELIPGSWQDSKSLLLSGNAELMTTVSHSMADPHVLFSKEPIADVWGQVFVRQAEPIEDWADLEGLTVGVPRDGRIRDGFIDFTNKKGIHCSFREFKNNNELLTAVKLGSLDAGVASHHFGASWSPFFSLYPTPIEFAHYPVYFICKKGENSALLDDIDAQMVAWKRDKNSYYYESMNRWLGVGYDKTDWTGRTVRLVGWIAAVLVVVVLGVLVWVRLLQRAVRKRTFDLKNALEAMANFFEQPMRLNLIGSITGEISRVNEAWFDALGYTEAELQGKKYQDFVHPDDLAHDYEIRDQLLAGKVVSYYENRFRHKSGAYRTLAWSAVPALESGKIYSVAKDITEEKEAKEKLLLLSAAIHSAGEAVIVTDVQFAIEYVNPAFERISGYVADEVLGATTAILNGDQHTDNFYWNVLHTIKAGQVWSGRLTNKRKDGTLYVEEGTISPVRDTEGQITHYVGVGRDITTELEVEQQYRQRQKLESVGQLAGGVAHDLNNLLTPVLGYSQILKDDPELPAGFRLPVEQIIQSGIRARDLVRQLLTFSRKGDSEQKNIDINGVISGFECLVRNAAPENISLSFDLAENLPVILADSGQIEQIVMNLVVNARDAMPDGGAVQIRTRLAELEAGQRLKSGLMQVGDYVELSVQDNGVGMDEQTVGKIFEPFFTTKEIGKGTGLGLSTVFGIVKQHGGAILVDSAVGQGALFKLLFPVSPTQKMQEPLESDSVSPDMGRGEIWLVEDEPAVREIVEVTLKLERYTVSVFDSPLACLAFMEQRIAGPQLLITDIVMPEINGKELAGMIREKWTNTKVLFMSGYSRDIISFQDLTTEPICFLSKPFSSKELMDVVHQILKTA